MIYAMTDYSKIKISATVTVPLQKVDPKEEDVKKEFDRFCLNHNVPDIIKNQILNSMPARKILRLMRLYDSKGRRHLVALRKLGLPVTQEDLEKAEEEQIIIFIKLKEQRKQKEQERKKEAKLALAQEFALEEKELGLRPASESPKEDEEDPEIEATKPKKSPQELKKDAVPFKPTRVLEIDDL